MTQAFFKPGGGGVLPTRSQGGGLPTPQKAACIGVKKGPARGQPLRLGREPLHGIEDVDLLIAHEVDERCDELRAGTAKGSPKP